MKLLSLISGGIDSPVAAYLMMQKDCEIVFVHFYNFTHARQAVKSKVEQLVKILTKYQKGQACKLSMVPFAEIQQQIIGIIPAKYRMIIYRRLMFTIAEKILEQEKAFGFVTGDNVGQVASQTLTNLTVIYKAAKKPMVTPLLGFDKQEIVDLAKKIGTYETSILPYSDCCSFLIAKHPETRAKLEMIEKLESLLDIPKLVQLGMGKAEIKISN
ncbi:7-cyano-7-deazaguanine synthase [Candidatus Woesearchaeota archaeon]|nr:7-cyano-7-deazaguanine synthase [Candidatus Woesearchaeota archaeon]